MLTPKRGIENYHRINNAATGKPVTHSLDDSALVIYTLLIITYIKPPVIDSDAIAKPSIVISGGFLCQGFFTHPW